MAIILVSSPPWLCPMTTICPQRFVGPVGIELMDNQAKRRSQHVGRIGNRITRVVVKEPVLKAGAQPGIVLEGVQHVLEEYVFHEPVVIFETLFAALERIGAKIKELGDAHWRQGLAPDRDGARAPLFGENDLPLTPMCGHPMCRPWQVRKR